jgi:hypothetical protein
MRFAIRMLRYRGRVMPWREVANPYCMRGTSPSRSIGSLPRRAPHPTSGEVPLIHQATALSHGHRKCHAPRKAGIFSSRFSRTSTSWHGHATSEASWSRRWRLEEKRCLTLTCGSDRASDRQRREQDCRPHSLLPRNDASPSRCPAVSNRSMRRRPRRYSSSSACDSALVCSSLMQGVLHSGCWVS